MERWRNCRYLLWGLGNSQWNAFLAFPRYIHRKLSELGATPLAEFAYGDVGSPVWERLHQEWNTRVWPGMLELSGAQPTEAAAARVAAEKTAEGALTRADSNTAMAMSLGPDDTASRVVLVPKILTNTVGVQTIEARVRACRELQAQQSPKRTRHLEITLPPGVRYRAGDHLGVCPKNDEERVESLARRLGAALDGLLTVPHTLNVRGVPKGVVLQVRNVLTNLVDIAGMPTIELLDLLLSKVNDSFERERLNEMKAAMEDLDGPDSRLRRAIRAGGYDVLNLLDEFPSCSLNIFEFLQVAQPLRPRYYSTSSSPRIHGDGVAHLAVGLTRTPVPEIPGREFSGVSARYLHTLRERDRINVFLESADGFHMQEDVEKPMVFVSVGTGFAPMRAFLWERLALQRDGVALGEAALFNGIRSSTVDYVYRDEIERFVAKSVLDHVYVATSRQAPDKRVYVQNLIRQQGALIWRLINAGAYVYVCGSQPMRDSVRAAFVGVAGEHGSLSPEHAEALMHQLETTENRYRPDVWG
jgi:cytochrome P450/NADPH-cytochrome P450 reductase